MATTELEKTQTEKDERAMGPRGELCSSCFRNRKKKECKDGCLGYYPDKETTHPKLRQGFYSTVSTFKMATSK